MAISSRARCARTPARSIADLPGALPVANVPADADAIAVAQVALGMLRDLQEQDIYGNALWRDIFALTGTLRTFHSPRRICKAWQHTSRTHKPVDFKLVPQTAKILRPGPPGVSWVQTLYTFRTTSNPSFTVKGSLNVVPDSKHPSRWKIWLVTSMLDRIESLPSPDVMSARQAWGTDDGTVNDDDDGTSTPDRALTPASTVSSGDCDYDCVVIGGGQAGLALGGYLQALGTRYIIFDEHATVGGMWTQRYDSVSMHTSRDYGQLPFGNVWGADVPYHLRKLHLAEGYATYVKRHDINIMLSTTVERSSFDDSARTWTVMIKTMGSVSYLRTKHLVMALGAGGQIPRYPNVSNRDTFAGKMLHSADYRNASAWRGKRAIVIGSANTAHDICNDMLNAGCGSVTMVQRGRTPVLPIECWSNAYDKLYREDVPLAQSDAQTMCMPVALQRAMNMAAVRKYSSEHPELYDGLERAGFKVERCMDLYHCLYERFGGHYIDVGVSRKIVDGSIKVKNDAALMEFDAEGLVFGDGSRLDADVVVFATGFEGNMRDAAEEIVGPEVAARLDDWWGVDEEGEIRGAWKPMGHPNIWFTGGNIAVSRFFARFLALQIRADVAGTPLQVYSDRL